MNEQLKNEILDRVEELLNIQILLDKTLKREGWTQGISFSINLLNRDEDGKLNVSMEPLRLDPDTINFVGK